MKIIDFTQPVVRKSYIIKCPNIGNYFLNAKYDEHKTRNEGIRALNFSDSELEGEKNQKLLKIKNMLTLSKETSEHERHKLKYFCGFQALQQFNTRIENAQLPERLGFPERVISQSLEGEVDDKFDTKLRDILALQSQHIKNLMLQQRGTDDKPEEAMLRYPIEWSDIEIDNHATNPIQKTIVRIRKPRTNAELIGFKLGKKPENSDPNEKELSYLDNAFEDLDNYCQGIMCNYKALKKFITDGYHKYFDEQGNPKKEPVASAE